jgi:hypothetical protein
LQPSGIGEHQGNRRSIRTCAYQKLHPRLIERDLGAVGCMGIENKQRVGSPGGGCAIASGHLTCDCPTGTNLPGKGQDRIGANEQSVVRRPVEHSGDEARQPSGTRRLSLGQAIPPPSVSGSPSPATSVFGNCDSRPGNLEVCDASESR